MAVPNYDCFCVLQSHVATLVEAHQITCSGLEAELQKWKSEVEKKANIVSEQVEETCS